MKKALYLIAALLLAGIAAQAQTIYLGPKIGANISTLAVSPNSSLTNYKQRVGLHVGAMANVGLSEMFSIQAELGYSQLGSKIEVPIVGTTTDLSLGYMEIPVMAQLKLGAAEKLQFFVEAGAGIGLFLSGKFEDESVNKEDYKGSNFFGAFGGGLLIPAGQGKVMLGARYGLGLSDINNSRLATSEIKTRNIGISAGYLIDF